MEKNLETRRAAVSFMLFALPFSLSVSFPQSTLFFTPPTVKNATL